MRLRALAPLLALFLAAPAAAQTTLSGNGVKVAPLSSAPSAFTLGSVGLWTPSTGGSALLPTWRKSDGTDITLGSSVVSSPLTGAGTSGSPITCPTCVVTTGSYANPSWITSLAATKITGTSGGVPFFASSALTQSTDLTFSSTTLGVGSGSGSPVISINGTGAGAPTFSSLSAGTRLILQTPGVDSTHATYGLGIESGNMWFGLDVAPDTSHGFKWYAGTTLISHFRSDGNFSFNVPGSQTTHPSISAIKVMDFRGDSGSTSAAMTVWGDSSLTNFLTAFGGTVSGANGIGFIAKTGNLIYFSGADLPSGGVTHTRWASIGASGLAIGNAFSINSTTGASYALDIRNSTIGSQVHSRSGGVGDDGAYLMGNAAAGATLSGGAAFNSSSQWIAKSTSAEVVDLSSNSIALYADTGLTAGNAFTPTKRFEVTAAGATVSGSTLNVATLDIKPAFTTPSDGQVIAWSAANSAYIPQSVSGTGAVTGSGTSGTFAKWSGTSSLANSSNLTEASTTVTLASGSTLTLTSGTVNGTYSIAGTPSLGVDLNANSHKVTSLTQGTASTDALAAGRNVNTTSGHLTGGGALTSDLTLGLPSVGPGATTTGGGSAYILSIATDAQGRISSLTTGTPSGTGITGSGTTSQLAYWSSSSALTSSANWTWDGTSSVLTRAAIGTAQTTGLKLDNSTAAANGAQQNSPQLELAGRGFASTGSVNQTDKFALQVIPTQGTTNSTAVLAFQGSINGASYGNLAALSSAGNFAVGSVAPDATADAGGIRVSVVSTAANATGQFAAKNSTASRFAALVSGSTATNTRPTVLFVSGQTVDVASKADDLSGTNYTPVISFTANRDIGFNIPVATPIQQHPTAGFHYMDLRGDTTATGSAYLAGNSNLSSFLTIASGESADNPTLMVHSSKTLDFATASDPVGTGYAARLQLSTTTFTINVNASLAAGVSVTAAAGSGALSFGSATGAGTMPTGNFSWTGASGKTGSIVSNGAALTLTSNAAATWSSTSGALTVDSAAALNLGTSAATSVVVGKTTTSTTVAGFSTFDGANGLTLTKAVNMTSVSGLALGYTSLSPVYYLDIRNASQGALVHFRSNAITDDGGYLYSAAASEGTISGGAAVSGVNWVAKATSASITSHLNGAFTWFADTGLTIGNTFTPTTRMSLSTTALTLSVASLTAGQASTWSTSSGALTVDSAAALNLGTSAATSVVVGKTTTQVNDQGGLRTRAVSKSANYTITVGDSWIECTAGGFTLTLPAPATAGAGAVYYIVDTTGGFGASNLTLARSGTEKINGTAASATLTVNRGIYTATTDGTDWYVSVGSTSL